MFFTPKTGNNIDASGRERQDQQIIRIGQDIDALTRAAP
jgi:hypothetical protein